MSHSSKYFKCYTVYKYVYSHKVRVYPDFWYLVSTTVHRFLGTLSLTDALTQFLLPDCALAQAVHSLKRSSALRRNYDSLVEVLCGYPAGTYSLHFNPF